MTSRSLAVRAGLVGLAALAAGFVRTTSEATGVPLFWPVPIAAYTVNPVVDPAAPNMAPSCDPTGAAAPAIEAVRAGFAAWDQGCSDLRLVYGGTLPEIRTGLTGSTENVVVMRRGWCSQHPLASVDPCMTDPEVDCGGIYNCFEDTGRFAGRAIVASTSVLYDPFTGRIYGADIEFVGWDGVAGGSLTGQQHGYYFTCDTESPPATRPTCTTYGEADCNGYDLQNTATHEAGHFVGLAHPCGEFGTPACSAPLPPTESVPYDQRTMYRLTAIGETSKRFLSADDVGGVCAVYPPSGGCGCGSGGEPAALGTVLAALVALALRPRLR